MKNYQALSQFISARNNCSESANTIWLEHWEERIKYFIEKLPSGSGIDSHWNLLYNNPEKIVLANSYHCMDDVGYYDGWIDFKVRITPSLLFDMRLEVIGNFSQRHNKYRNVKNYIEQALYEFFSEEYQDTAGTGN
jgi:hypothetical protein